MYFHMPQWPAYDLVVRQGGALVALGLLSGAGPSDPLTLVLAVTLLGVMGLVATWLPARRAVKVDPQEAFRE